MQVSQARQDTDLSTKVCPFTCAVAGLQACYREFLKWAEVKPPLPLYATKNMSPIHAPSYKNLSLDLMLGRLPNLAPKLSLSSCQRVSVLAVLAATWHPPLPCPMLHLPH